MCLSRGDLLLNQTLLIRLFLNQTGSVRSHCVGSKTGISGGFVFALSIRRNAAHISVKDIFLLNANE